ncbi:YidC/Oxa1 family membrane protein insertase [Streptomyces sp. NPDC048718]|uniref:YidC/Oxa1 family membrane protein insertase n=1 Tax=Streptomyces sp. NPDC048718 TaxID=3365587 RepID=UPI003720ACE9
MSLFFDTFADLIERCAGLLTPLFAGASAAAAIVLFTMAVRLAVHPLSRAAARGQKARTRLAPQLAELRRKHAKNPERLQKAVMELHAKEKVSPFAGCLPSLLQAPAFFLMYHLFSSGRMAGHDLFGASLTGRAADAFGQAGPFGPAGLTYLALFAIVAATATYTFVRTRRQQAAASPAAPVAGPAQPGAGAVMALTRHLPLLSFATLITVAVVPLAAALYVVTSTVWTAVERAFLYQDMPAGALAAPAASA